MNQDDLIRLIDPTPNVCHGRQPPRFPPAGSQFIRDVICTIGTSYLAATVDGYIVTSSGQVTRIFFKREFEILQAGAQPLDYANALTRDESVCAAKVYLNAVAKLLGCGVDYLFSPTGYPYSMASVPKMLLVSVDDVDSGRARRRYIDSKELAQRIRSYRGRSFKNAKPVTVATSAIECYLANGSTGEVSSDPFPGDLDFILLEGGRACLIAEFKTHNLASPIKNESCANYSEQDWRRLEVLLTLKRNLNCKLFYVFWGPNHHEVKVEELMSAERIGRSVVLEKNAKILADFFESVVVNSDRSEF